MRPENKTGQDDVENPPAQLHTATPHPRTAGSDALAEAVDGEGERLLLECASTTASLCSTTCDNPTWSSDGRFIYMDAPESPDPAIYRISIPSKRMERIARLKGVQRVHGDMGAWIGLTPDNVPLILRAGQAEEIFAWGWIAP